MSQKLHDSQMVDNDKLNKIRKDRAMGTDRRNQKSWIKRHWQSVTAVGALGVGLTTYLGYRLSEPPPIVQPMPKGEKPLTFQDVMIPLGNSAGPVSQNKI